MQNIIIFDFGRGKNNQLITKQIREQGVYCELWDMKSHSISEAKLINPLGAIVLGTADPQELQTLGVPVLELPDGLASKLVLKNFLFDKCGCTGEWNMAQYSEKLIEEIRETVGDGKALLALSGGVDSSVCAVLMARAIGDRLTCIFVDHGFMRKNELAEIKEAFKDINLICVDAKEQFMSRLSGVTSPEEKRKIIGEEFIRVFEREAKKLNNSGSISSERVDFFVQGTIYPDIIESGMGSSSVIKSHHNVGGLPEHIDFKAIIEPLKLLFKNEVRELGTHLGLDERLVKRQPFPGPGLAVRVIGELTKEKLDILREADCVFRNVIEESELDRNINQYFAVLTPLRSVGVRNNERTYEYTVALRAVVTTDFVTADFAKIPYDVLEKASVRIVNECKNINRVVYDITSKPPATIEWE